MSQDLINTKLNSKWTLWYHHQKDNWKLEGYRQIYTVETIKDFWSLFKNLHIIGGISKLQYFFMRENITPLWEDPKKMRGYKRLLMGPKIMGTKITVGSKNYMFDACNY